jgi:hypothetical protein
LNFAAGLLMRIDSKMAGICYKMNFSDRRIFARKRTRPGYASCVQEKPQGRARLSVATPGIRAHPAASKLLLLAYSDGDEVQVRHGGRPLVAAGSLWPSWPRLSSSNAGLFFDEL